MSRKSLLKSLFSSRGNPIHRGFFETLEFRRLLASPIVITQGGTYSGTWESDDPNTPAVTVDTSEPVIIENSTISSRGTLIASGTSHTNITVRNSSGYGLNPDEYGQAPGRFLEVDNFDNVVVQDNDLQNTSGIYLAYYSGDHSSSNTVKVTGNQALNIDGRKSDGNGGWLDFNTRTRISDGSSEDGFEIVQFLQFNHVGAVAGIDVGWNKVVNQPGQSRVEDNISVYRSSGTSSSPISIHDNYIQGAYNVAPWKSDSSDSTYDYDWSFSGGGIMLGDGVGSDDTDPSYVNAYGNTIVNTTNYGMAIAAGHNDSFHDNTVVSSGVLPDGRTNAVGGVGAYVWDSYGAGSTHFYSDSGYNNTIGYVQSGSRNDWWSPDSSTMPDNNHMSGDITTATEQAAYDAWQTRFEAQGGTSRTPDAPIPPVPVPPDPDPRPNPTPTPNASDSISGSVFLDANQNARRDSTENGLSGWTVFIDANNNGWLDSSEKTDVTDSNGDWSFSNLADGTYNVRVKPLDSSLLRTTASYFKHLVQSGSNFTGDHFGYAPPNSTTDGSISGSVFLDANDDDARDNAETGLSGWTVFIDANNNGWLDSGERTDVTNAQGDWSFDNLTPGVYNIRVKQLDKSLTRTTISYHKHLVRDGSSFTNDEFGYA